MLGRHLGLRRLEREKNISTESVKALLNREPNEWISELRRSKEDFYAEARSDRNLKWDGHVRSMLRAVVELAGGPTNTDRKEFDRSTSADENLAALGCVFGVDTEPGLVAVDGSDTKHARELVSEALKPVTTEDALDFRNLTGVIGFPFYAHPNLPTGLLSSLSIQTITAW